MNNLSEAQRRVLSCPECGQEIDATNVDDCDAQGVDGPCYFGIDLIEKYGPQKDLLGRTIRSHRYGNCSNCFAAIELINGKVSRSVHMPITEAGRAALQQSGAGEG